MIDNCLLTHHVSEGVALELEQIVTGSLGGGLLHALGRDGYKYKNTINTGLNRGNLIP